MKCQEVSMIPFIFKNKKTNHTYSLPVKEYRYGIVLMDSDEEPEDNPQLVVIGNSNDEKNSLYLFSNKEEAIDRLTEMRGIYPSCTYKLIRYTLLSN